MTEPNAPYESLVLIAWSRVWSPVAPSAWFEEAWTALALPPDEDFRDTEFCSLFHAGLPAPRVPLLLHAALDRSGDVVRMDWMRVMAHLGLEPGETMPQPDHLAIACEILAQAVAAGEDVIVRELSNRYLLPWCDAAEQRLADDDARFTAIVERFRRTIVVDAVAGLAAVGGGAEIHA